jgi:4-aminobutyrate aminotransferase-like enzyme
MDTYPAGAMTSTHSGSPLSVAAGLGALEALREDRLVERAAALEPVLAAGLASIERVFGELVGCVLARGLVGGVRVVQRGTLEPDSGFAARVIESCVRRGLLLFAPVGLGGGCVKIAPPLCISESALGEGLEVLAESFRVAAVNDGK